MMTAFLRTVILYFLIMAGLRLMGKRQIGELEPSELVLTMMLSDLATVPMQDFGIPLLAGVIPILTLLAQTGQVPMSGETPGAFARRVGAQTRNPDFIAFADAVAMSVYARAGASRESVEQGRCAYRAFLSGLRRGERLRFAVTRIFKGLGDFESIP